MSFGVFTGEPRPHASDLTENDSHGYRWCPSDPPPERSAQEIDPIYGIITTSQKEVTRPSQTRVVWLDCSKPLRFTFTLEEARSEVREQRNLLRHQRKHDCYCQQVRMTH